MIDFKKWIPTACLVVSLILTVSSLYMPWWGVWNSMADQLATNNTKVVYYMPLQTIIAGNAQANVSIAMSFNDLAENDTNKSALSNLFTTALDITIVGMVLTIITLVLIVMTTLRKKPFKHVWLIGIVGAILLFLASFYITQIMPPTFTKFNSIAPSEIGVIPGKQISSFWGSSGIWVWSAGYGWLLLLMSALLGAIGSMLAKQSQERAE
jgi:hypothetical protein